jgi:hypothetical protein
LEYPYAISFHFNFLTIFVVNGKLQKFHFPERSISFYGFKGFAPTSDMFTIKALTLIGRIRVIGQCEAINVMDL